jgi:hypothetical protein
VDLVGLSASGFLLGVRIAADEHSLLDELGDPARKFE